MDKTIIPNSTQQRMDKNDFIVSKTDLKGKLTYCNEIFIKFARLSEKELLTKPHNIVRHPDMPRLIFKLLWDRIQNKKEIFAYVKNLAADGSFYWVYANVTASVDDNNNTIGYYSVRRKPKDSALAVIEDLYRVLLDKEKHSGVAESELYLNNLLKEKEMSYDEFINSIQNGVS